MTSEQIVLLEKMLAKLALKKSMRPITRGDWEATKSYVVAGATRAFGAESVEVTRLSQAFRHIVRPDNDMFNEMQRFSTLDAAEQVLDSIFEIQSELLHFDPSLTAGLERIAHASNSKVFVVHGHHDALRESVARFLERAKLEPIILAEQANGGHTIIEKLEANSDVAYSVVLLTADDVGGKSESELKPRARQNVVFELGYFVGLLARSRVCALVEEGVEIFSDISGVTYIPVDREGAWKARLAKELSGAGLAIDLTALI